MLSTIRTVKFVMWEGSLAVAYFNGCHSIGLDMRRSSVRFAISLWKVPANARCSKCTRQGVSAHSISGLAISGCRSCNEQRAGVNVDTIDRNHGGAADRGEFCQDAKAGAQGSNRKRRDPLLRATICERRHRKKTWHQLNGCALIQINEVGLI
jgi:hypothetical protein